MCTAVAHLALQVERARAHHLGCSSVTMLSPSLQIAVVAREGGGGDSCVGEKFGAKEQSGLKGSVCRGCPVGATSGNQENSPPLRL